MTEHLKDADALGASQQNHVAYLPLCRRVPKICRMFHAIYRELLSGGWPCRTASSVLHGPFLTVGDCLREAQVSSPMGTELPVLL